MNYEYPNGDEETQQNDQKVCMGTAARNCIICRKTNHSHLALRNKLIIKISDDARRGGDDVEGHFLFQAFSRERRYFA